MHKNHCNNLKNIVKFTYERYECQHASALYHLLPQMRAIQYTRAYGLLPAPLEVNCQKYKAAQK